jgi:hypothetical protein
MLRCKRDEDLYNEELHHLYSLPNSVRLKIKEDELGRTCSKHGGNENCM